MNVWNELGIAPGSELREIKLAYARRIKQVHPEDDPEGFQRLRQAYEAALKQAQTRAVPAAPPAATQQAPAQDAPQPEPEPEPEPQHDRASPPRQRAAPASSSPPLLQRPSSPVQEPSAPAPPKPRPAPSSPQPPPSPPQRPVPATRQPVIESSSGSQSRLQQPEIVQTPPPAQAVRTLLDQLLTTPAEQRPAVLTASRRIRGWENLDFQLALEQMVAVALLKEFDRLFVLIEPCVAHYGWRTNPVGQRSHDKQIDTLLARLAARKRLRAMESSRKRADAPQRRALGLLLREPREAAFRRYARWDRNIKAIRALLKQLQAHDQNVLRFEINTASARWWTDYLKRTPVTWDLFAWRLVFGVLLGPVVLIMLVGMVSEANGYDLLAHWWIGSPLAVLLMAAPLGHALAQHAWRNSPWSARAVELRQQWRTQPRQRRIVQAITALCLLLSAGAGSIPGFWVFAVLTVMLLWFWTNLRFALLCLTVLAWPLQAPLSLLAILVAAASPALVKHADIAWLLLGVPHWPAMFLVAPFNRRCAAIYSSISKGPPRDPIKFVFYTAVALCMIGIVIASVAINPQKSDNGNAPTPITQRRPVPKPNSAVDGLVQYLIIGWGEKPPGHL